MANNGAAAFTIFRDDENNPNSASGSSAVAGQEGWQDFGTTSSRRRENERTAIPWKGETLPSQQSSITPSTSAPRFEIFRDEDAEAVPAATSVFPSGPTENGEGLGGLGSKHIRAPGEAELLRKNPFRNYGGQVVLSDSPKPGNVPIPVERRPSKPATSSSTGASTSDAPRSKPSSATSKTKTTSSSAFTSTSKTSTSSLSVSAGDKKAERVASPLSLIYPQGLSGPEYSIEELAAHRRHLRNIDTGKDGKAAPQWKEWEVQARNEGKTWRYDESGCVTFESQLEAADQRIIASPSARELEAVEQARREAEEQRRVQEHEALRLAHEQERQEKEAIEREQARVKAEEAAAQQAREQEERQRRLAEKVAKEREEHEAAEREREQRIAQEAEEQHRAYLERKRKEKEQNEREEQQRERSRLAQEAREREEESARQQLLDAERPRQIEHQRKEDENRKRQQKEAEEAVPTRSSNRPPSPTINTKAALEEVHAMFGKTMRFDEEGRSSSSDTEHSSSDDDDDGFDGTPMLPPSQAETEDTFWMNSQASQQQSQARTGPGNSQASVRSGIDSESGETTEGSDSEADENYQRGRADQLALPGSLGGFHQSLSRSSSSSSSASSSGYAPPPSSSELASHLASTSTSPTVPFKPSRVPGLQQRSGALSDENQSVPMSSARPAFKPSRAPLAAKSAGLGRAAGPSKPPAFSIFAEEPVQASADTEALPAKPSKEQPRRALAMKPAKMQIYSDDEQTPSYPEEIADATSQADVEDVEQQQQVAPGFAMGRRVAGPSRFAGMMDVMTPITERTLEFGMATCTLTSEHGGTAGARMLTHRLGTDDDEVEIFEERFAAEDLASSRGSNWEEGRRQLELIDEEEEGENVSARHDRSASLEGERFFCFLGPHAESLQQLFKHNLGQSGASTILADQEEAASSSQRFKEPSQKQQGLAPIDPLSTEIMQSILTGSSIPLERMDGFVDCRDRKCRKLDSLQKMTKIRRKSAGSARSSGAHEEAGYELELHKATFSVREKLGEGGYGAVFRVEEMLDEEREGEEDGRQTAIKVQSPANVWEYFALKTMHSRLPEHTLESIVRAQGLYAYQDESYLLLDYCDQGTLLDAVNHAQEAGIGPSSAGTGMDETLAMFFTVELTRILASLHASRFTHGDFKIDNCLVRLEDVPGGAKGWSNAYQKDGTGGWRYKGVKIIDFGRTVDLEAFPEGQTFQTNWTTDMHDCAEMKEGKPWRYQPDYYNLACCAHVLLFGKYLETVTSTDDTTGRTRYSIKEPLKRYHQAQLWTPFFDLLLNPTIVQPDASKPLTEEIMRVRREMEAWLEENANKGGKSLKGMLKKLEIWALSRGK